VALDLGRGEQDQVDVIVLEAVVEHLVAEFGGDLVEDGQEEGLDPGVVEEGLAVVAAVGDVDVGVGDVDAAPSGHGYTSRRDCSRPGDAPPLSRRAAGAGSQVRRDRPGRGAPPRGAT
jgi:hypothetical protein